MIISVSRRTDIPALHMNWFAERLKEGFVLSRNPYNARQIRRVDLDPQDTQFVFWTKDAEPMLRFLPLLGRYPFYVQFTITPYGPETEPGLRPQRPRIETLRRLSDQIGPERVLWRCDPFVWSPDRGTGWLAEQFDRLAGLRAGTAEETRQLALLVREAANARGLTVSACCEPETADLLLPARCIDAGRLSRIAGRPIASGKERHQRPGCTCSASVDIGIYDTCRHGCLYCYATHTKPKKAGSGPLSSAATQIEAGRAQ